MILDLLVIMQYFLAYYQNRRNWSYIPFQFSFKSYVNPCPIKNPQNGKCVSFWIETKDLNIRSQRRGLQHDLYSQTKYSQDVAIFFYILNVWGCNIHVIYV